MGTAPLPEDEEQRLAALYDCGILDSLPEANYDNLTQLLAELIGTPWAFVAFLDRDRQWFKSHHGIEIEQTPRDTAFSAHVILQDEALVVEDATLHEPFKSNTSVTGPPHIRFYAGAPIVLDGHKVGALCVAAPTPMTINEKQRRALKSLSAIVCDELLLRRNTLKLNSKRDRLFQAERLASIGQLAAGVAHEINSPIQYVSSNLSFSLECLENLSAALKAILEVKVDDRYSGKIADFPSVGKILETHDIGYMMAEGKRAAVESQAGVERVRHIVSALNFYSHVAEDKPKPQDINAAIRNSATLTTYAWKNHAQLDLALTDNLSPCLCYITDISQVLINLIVNAADSIAERRTKHRDVQGVIILRSFLEGDELIVQVEDNGEGISEENLPKLFKPFFTTKPVGKGTGQGLALSYDLIIRRNGGKLEVQSTPAEFRTIFTIRLALPK
jgi:hypothetical protein